MDKSGASPRRASRIGVVLVAGLLVAAAGQAEAAKKTKPVLRTPIVSGLSWRSGSTGDACLATLRGRALDAVNVFLGHTSFPGLARQTAGMRPRQGIPLMVASLPLLTSDTRGQFAQCAAGAFDGYFAQIGANLQKAGAQGTVVRLGWEANVGSDSHPWGVDTPDQVPAYRACWRRAATQLKTAGPGILVEWTSAKKTNNTFIHVLDMYPGDDIVDLWGVHYYDSGPEKNTQPVWDQYYNATFNGQPWGLGTWVAAAKAHHKQLGIGEWGVWRQGATTAAQADDPVYIANMYRFFSTNAASIAYETYFNAMPDQHTLCNSNGTPTSFPNAAAASQPGGASGMRAEGPARPPPLLPSPSEPSVRL